MCTSGHAAISPTVNWAPKVVSGAIPNDAPFVEASVTAYVSLNDFVENFGHAMFDFLFPVFNTLQMMNLYRPDFQLLLAEHQASDAPACCPVLQVTLPALPCSLSIHYYTALHNSTWVLATEPKQ